MVAMAALLLGLWVQYFLVAWQTRGLFAWLGFDYGYFWAVTHAILAGGARAAYDPTRIAHASQALLPYYAPAVPGQDRPLTVAAPWPPVLFLYYAPFALLPLPLGYLAWLVANMALAAVVVHDLARRLDRPSGPHRRDGRVGPPWSPWPRRGAMLLALTSVPVAYTLFFGQPSILWLAALWRAYCAFERRQEARAGLWAGVLLLKPQYAIFLGLVLCYKRRWRAVAGMAVMALGLAGSSLLVLGPHGVLAYVGAVRALTGFRLTEPLIAPDRMICWRGLLLNVLPASVPDTVGLALSMGLTALTASTLLVVWRGAWDPQTPRFGPRLLATMLVTMLASFHNHIHGATLLVVPAMVLAASPTDAATWSSGVGTRSTGGASPSSSGRLKPSRVGWWWSGATSRWSVARVLPLLLPAALLVPAALIFAGAGGVVVSTYVIALMAATLMVLLVEELRTETQPPIG
jgi:hypothetical protein